MNPKFLRKTMKYSISIAALLSAHWLAAQAPPALPTAPLPSRAIRSETLTNSPAAAPATNPAGAKGAATGLATNPPSVSVPPRPSLGALTNLLRTNITSAATAGQTNRPATIPSFPPPPTTPSTTPGTVAGGASTNRTAAGTTAGAATGAEGTKEEIIQAGVIKFQAADLNSVLEVYAELVNRTILRPATLPDAKITLKTQTPLTRSEAIRALEAVMNMNQITLISVGEKFVKVIPQQQAFQEGQRPVDPSEVEAMPELAPFVTVIRQLTNAKPSEVTTALQPFAKMQGGVVPIDSSGILVLRDYADNVKRMQEMIDKIDISIPMEVEPVVIPIKYALAGDIAQVLGQLTAGGTVASTGSSGGSSRGLSSRSSSSSFGRGGTTGGYPGQQGYNPMNPQGSTTSGIRPTTTPGAAQSTFADRLRNIVSRAAGTADFEVLGEAKIIADERINALLVFASKQDMQMITNIIAKLDTVLAQVLIEALVIEVSINDNEDYGISYLQRPSNKGSWTGAGSVFTGAFTSPEGITSLSSNLSSGFTYVMRWGSFDIAMKAAASDGRISVLSRPRVQTSHAKEAHLFVGETRPYPTGSYYGGGYGGGYSSIQQLQIGIQLDVLPLINPDGLVVLEIAQRIQNVGDTVDMPNVGPVPTTVDREANATVAVRDGDTIVLGGFISADHSKSKAGVPFLKDIPGLGALFRSSNEKRNRKELMVFIRPTVLQTPEAAATMASAEHDRVSPLSEAEKEFRRDEEERVRQLQQGLQTDQRGRSKPARNPGSALDSFPMN